MTPEQIRIRYEKKFIDSEYMLKKRASLLDLSFRELKIYYSEKGYHIDDKSFEANLNLKNENGEIEKPKEVKIYLEKDDKRIDIYNGNISGTNYYFDMIINNLEGEYTIYAEAKADDRKYI